ncbi:hypothetical protein HYU17_04215 [Candidatus Woesearchaeota archaeon]|nr:hypothetical protein [Candidatus Woesearchaeota archaeon]
MVLSADGLDLETLANMGITKDRGGRLRIGHDVAREMGLGGGRWLKKEEEAKVPDAIKGYGALPEELRAGNTYSTIERFHFAAEAGRNGVPVSGQAFEPHQHSLEGKLDAAKVRTASDGLPQRSVLAAYWNHNGEQAGKGYAPVTTKQFIEGLVAGVEQQLKNLEGEAIRLTGEAKSFVVTDAEQALKSALTATYLKRMVDYLTPKLAAAKSRGNVPGNGIYEAASQQGAAAASA